MSFAGPRDPIRNRQYYEDRRVLSSDQSLVTARLTNMSDSTSGSPSESIFDGGNGGSTTQKSRISHSTSGRLPMRISVTHSSPTRISGGGAGELGRLVKNAWNDIKELLGYLPPCLNGGTRLAGGPCRCPKLFEGAECEKRICLNGGKLERTKYGPVSWDCKCPTPQYIEGTHCETVRCANNAHLRTETTNGSWWCDCSGSMFYSGRFCEEFTAPYAVFAIPLACLFVIRIVYRCMPNGSMPKEKAVISSYGTLIGIRSRIYCCFT
ncbi:hypothetical protein KIN20_022118 [Parelaphostrongylus tenuis]|uniref:EGF-like domain-containing protein n=1 Tax=Parelaphostrongylus tenuis TaxID=148309 RepID=A0AAD5QV00_PARTN|nr:hypothetical protein KIN20_022118 [Parelaphostrongylus tenuis]